MTPYAEVIGDPISHSKSPLIHRFWHEKLGLAADYRAIRIRSDEIESYLTGRVADNDWLGCNVTIPHKTRLFPHVADPAGIEATIGALNCVFVNDKGALVGTNTDAGGFLEPLAERTLAGKPVIVVGAGGAARAILYALRQREVGPVTLLNRSPDKGQALLDHFGLEGHAVALNRPLPPAALLVNASPLGMTGQPPLVLDLSPLPADATVYDAVYAPLETALLRAARARGLATIDGLAMLIGQAALAFEIFFDAAAPRQHDAELRRLLTA